MAQRLDIGRLDRAKRTGAGGARMPATIARTGVQTYHDASGRERREYRPPEAVFAPEAIATLGSIPVTIGHQGRVDARNWRQVSVGHISDAPARRVDDGGRSWIEADVVISDADALRRVDADELVEVSMGYDADVEETPGVTPAGEHYDAIQTRIGGYNHLALLPEGRARAGSGARLRLDSNGDLMFRTDEATPKRVAKIDGVDYEVGSDSHIQALELRATRAEARAVALETDLGAQRGRADAAEARIAAQPSVEALVADELAFRTRLAPALPAGYSFAGRTREQVTFDAVGPQVAAAVAALPEAQRPGYLAARLDDRLARAERPTHAPVKIDNATPPARFDAFAPLKSAYSNSFGGAR